MMEHGKELPPITLSKTTVSYLVTLIPVLVSMTSQGEVPSYEDDTDKPAWWPEDIQWRNPKSYMQDGDKKIGSVPLGIEVDGVTEAEDDVLQVLRKLVHSCYSYHGVEDLLCRLDETSTSDSELEPPDPTDIMQLTDDTLDVVQGSEGRLNIMQVTNDTEEGLEESSAESEGPVFVCCFCLDQFSSHEEVNTHQSICSKRFKDTNQGPEQVDQNSFSNSPSDTQVESFLEPSDEMNSTATSHASDFQSTVAATSSKVSTSSSSISTLSLPPYAGKHTSSVTSQVPVVTQASAVPSHLHASSAKRPASSTSYPFVPTLKTRSQKKLDQIMEKHTLRRLMIQECQQMKEVPYTGAWWVPKKKRKSITTSQHPDTYLSQDAFASSIGLAKKSDVEAKARAEAEQGAKKEQEVDLDCEIVSVEGPLSAVPAAPTDKQSSTSPRTPRSLISQLSRDTEASTRRRLSFCFVEDEWADKEALEEGRDPIQTSLLTLDFSSPLGQRVRKYVRVEGQVSVIKDPENFCKTEDYDDGYSKLRFRGCDYRVTYRKKRRASSFVHKYKFNRSDRLEFERLLKTGLSAHSRRLQQCLPQCRVVLNRMTESEIKSWTEEKKILIEEKIIYDDDICITQIEIPESKMPTGFAAGRISQSSVPSQGHMSRHAPHPQLPNRPSSTLGIKSSLTLTSSPPHIPNIFRNRSSHTPSPPRHGSCPLHHPLKAGMSSHTPKDRVHRTWGQGVSRPLFAGNTIQHKVQERFGESPSHLSRHKVLAPSAYSPGTLLADRKMMKATSNGVERQVSSPINNSNRRKQQLTHVRRDEGEGAGAHKGISSTGKGFVPLGSSITPNRTPTSGVSSSNSTHTPPTATRKLSNFDYYSIRDGKIQSSDHLRHTSLLPFNPDHQQNPKFSQHISHQNHASHNHNSDPASSSSSSQPQRSHLQQALQSQSNHSPNMPIQDRPSTVIHHGPSHHQREQRDGSQGVGPNCSHHSHPHNCLKRAGAKAPPLMGHLHSTLAVPGGIRGKSFVEKSQMDDDVMEVICIDDD